jgi:hypothetical protein
MKRELRSVTLKASPVPLVGARKPSRRGWRFGPMLLLYALGFVALELLLFRHASSSTRRRLVQVPEDSERFALLPPDLEDAEFAKIHVPRWMTDTDSDVPVQDREHLSWQHGAPEYSDQAKEPLQARVLERGDPRVLEQLKKCPDVDIYLPDGIRGLGYCEDAVAFTKCTLVEIEGALYKED